MARTAHDGVSSASRLRWGGGLPVGSLPCGSVQLAVTSLFFLSRAPWSALAAVGRGASGEKTQSSVRTHDRLYRAVEGQGETLRTQIRDSAK